MQIDWRGVLQRGLLGALGGLLGWALMTVVGVKTTNVYLADLLTGALVGLSMGVCCGAWDGVFRSRTILRTIKGMGAGALVGALGGMIGLMLGEVIHEFAGEGLIFRAMGWAIFGTLLGVNEGVTRRMFAKAAYGAYGGFLGGLMGGSTYEWLYGVCRVFLPRHLSQAVGGAVGLVLLGLFVGAMIGLVEDLLRATWLLFLGGRLEGQTRTLDSTKSSTVIGRSELADICITGDSRLQPRHLQVLSDNGSFYLESLEGDVQVERNGQSMPAGRQLLVAGDVLRFGQQRACFEIGGKQ